MSSESTENLRRTPLYDRHVELGGKVVPFAGWELPVQYSGVIPEHHAVRTAAGIFDVSHMGEVLVTGADAEANLQAMTCNNLATLVDGKAQYNAIINESGGVVDDIIVYRYSKERFFVCVNAANTAKDFAWFIKHATGRVTFENHSDRYGQIALQGPKALSILARMPGDGVKAAAIKPFHFADLNLAGVPVIVARTGYTGEDGAEIFIPVEKTVQIWDALLAHGAGEGLIPCGLGARDSLRLEACYPLHGHELSDELTAIESGLSWIVKLEKGQFRGSSVLSAQLASGAPRALVGFVVRDPGIARHGDRILSPSGEQIGVVTSGTKTPTVNQALGMAIVQKPYAAVGGTVQIEVRGRRLAAEIVKRPFYKPA
jgi:aminomethyltransferase